MRRNVTVATAVTAAQKPKAQAVTAKLFYQTGGA